MYVFIYIIKLDMFKSCVGIGDSCEFEFLSDLRFITCVRLLKLCSAEVVRVNRLFRGSLV